MKGFEFTTVTRDAINGVRERGFYGPLVAEMAGESMYVLISTEDRKVYATVASDVITYPSAVA